MNSTQEQQNRRNEQDRGPNPNGGSNGADPAQPQHDDHDAIPHDLPKVKSGTVLLVGIVVVIAFVGLFLVGWFPREHRIDEAKKDVADQDQRPVVDVITPQRKSKGFDLWIPADVRAFQETAIYPRTSGYLKRWLVDIGDQVKKDQLLAEIDTPEVDAQLNQSEATLEQTKANVIKAEADMNLAKVTLNRYLDANKQSPGSVTAQDVDEKQSAYDDAVSALKQVKASVVAQEADVHRLQVLQGFEKVTTPFRGIITARNYDNGALLSAGNTAAGSELFSVQETDTLRVFVNVPQTYVTAIKIGQDGFLNVRNYPGKEFKGTATRWAGALDPTTRTIRLEVDVPNPDGQLFAGMFGQLRLVVTPEQAPIMVPTSALVFDSNGMRVGVVQDNKVHFKDVQLGRDYGTDVEIATGLNGDEQVVSNPGLHMVEGGEVRVAAPEASDSGAPPQQQVSQR